MKRNRHLDHTNEKYGNLKVIEFSFVKNRCSYWKCICDCGNETIVRLSLLKNGNTKSCGCIQKKIASITKINDNKSRALPLGEAAKRSLFRIYKRNSNNRKIKFELTFEHFIKLTSANCYFCNIKPRQIHMKEDFNGSYEYNGIDRLDNNLGYTTSNSVPCCRWCNYSKNNRSESEFLLWVNNVYNHKLK